MDLFQHDIGLDKMDFHFAWHRFAPVHAAARTMVVHGDIWTWRGRRLSNSRRKRLDLQWTWRLFT
jgi:hypothetical protein